MTWYFAYGSNMNRALMRRLCAQAEPVGTATLGGYRFIITTDGFASIVPHAGGSVHGVLWKLSARDISALNAYEGLDSGLYTTITLPVRKGGRRFAAMVYVARSRSEGRPKPGYLDCVLQAAREWNLPESYVRSLARWAPAGWRGARAVETGEIG
jgi:cation transport regulator ChaC